MSQWQRPASRRPASAAEITTIHQRYRIHHGNLYNLAIWLSRNRRKKVSFAGIEPDNDVDMDEKNILTTKLRPRDALSQKAIEREQRLMTYIPLGSASSWKESYLDWLLVDVQDGNMETLLLDKIQSKGLTWTPAHQEGIGLPNKSS